MPIICRSYVAGRGIGVHAASQAVYAALTEEVREAFAAGRIASSRARLLESADDVAELAVYFVEEEDVLTATGSMFPAVWLFLNIAAPALDPAWLDALEHRYDLRLLDGYELPD